MVVLLWGIVMDLDSVGLLHYGATLQMKQQNRLASNTIYFNKYVESQGFIYTSDAPSAVVLPGGYALIFKNPSDTEECNGVRFQTTGREARTDETMAWLREVTKDESMVSSLPGQLLEYLISD